MFHTYVSWPVYSVSGLLIKCIKKNLRKERKTCFIILYGKKKNFRDWNDEKNIHSLIKKFILVWWMRLTCNWRDCVLAERACRIREAQYPTFLYLVRKWNICSPCPFLRCPIGPEALRKHRWSNLGKYKFGRNKPWNATIDTILYLW